MSDAKIVLPTFSELPLRSPIPEGERVEVAGKASLEDLSSSQLVVRVAGKGAEKALKRALGGAPSEAGGVLRLPSGALARLRADEFAFLIEEKGEVEKAIEKISVAAGKGMTITDVTQGRGGFRLSGPLSKNALSELCGLDFSEAAFPNLTAAQTSLAKAYALIVRLGGERGVPEYDIIVERSLAAYVWGALSVAIRRMEGII